MGVIKQISDSNIIDNVNELITPQKVRQVNDVIDAQVVAANTSITTLEGNVTTLQTNLSTTNNEILNLTQLVANSSGVPIGGTTGQLLAKASNTDRDTVWIDPPTGGGDFLPLTGGNISGALSVNGTLSVNSISGMGPGGLQINFGTKTVSTILKYSSAQTLTTALDLAHKGYVDAAITTAINAAAGGDYLPLDGSLGMNGDLDMASNAIGGVQSIYGDSGELNFLNEEYGSTTGSGLKYISDYSAGYVARSLVDKGYVDSSVRIAKKVLAGFPPQNTVITLDHNFDDTNVVVEIWVDFQNGSLNVGQGYMNMTSDVKFNIVRTSANQIKIDVIGDFTGQSWGEAQILVYSYKNAIVTVLP